MSPSPALEVERVGPHGSERWLDRARELVRERAWPLAVWAAMVGWSVVLFVVARQAYLEFRLGRFDLGNMVQAVWSTSQGRPLEMTEGATGEQMVRLGGHVDPFLTLLTPLWMVWPSPLALALAQVVVVALGALPAFWLARRHLGSERVAGLLALAYLAYPWLAVSSVAAIHPVTFAITFYLFCIWFLDAGRLGLFAVFAVLAMSTGELMGLPIAGLGVWYALAHRERVAGMLIAAGGAAWTFLAVFVVVPRYRGGDSVFFGFYDEVGGSPQGVVRMLFTDPSTVLGALVEVHDVVYVVWLALPLLGLFLLSPGLAAVGLPQLLANALSDFRSMTDPRYHSIAAIFPFLFAATVFGIVRLREHRRPLAVAAMLTISITLALAVGPWARAVGQTPLGGRETLSESKLQALRGALALVPDDAPVTASNAVGAHLSSRRYVYSVPVLGRAEWVVVDLDEPWVTRPGSPILAKHPNVVRKLARTLEADPGWEKVYERERVLAFHRLEP